MKTTTYLCLATATALSVLMRCNPASAAPGPDATKRPNILFFFTDDQRWDTIHALGNPVVQTPNLDRLVEQGFTFDNAYCMGSWSGAVCLPSRIMLMTGQSVWRIRGKKEKAYLPQVLKEAGYVTFRSGKGGNVCKAANELFDFNTNAGDDRRPETSKEHADRAIAFLRSHRGDRPFYMHLAFDKPHDPRRAPPQYMAMYDPSAIPLPASYLPRHPFDNGELYVRDELLAAFPRTPDEMRRHLADYYACVSDLDTQCGRILDVLRERGFAQNTIVVFSSDQGLAVGGAHGLMGKQNLYESNKPPLVFCGPGIPHGWSDALVYLFDLYPTFCDLAGARIPENVEGKSLLPILQCEKGKVRDYVYGAYKSCQRMIRDARWKLIKYHAGGAKHRQLFDLKNDPDETRNLADDPAYAGEIARLEKLLETARAEFDDPIDFEGAGGPASQPPKPKPRDKKSKSRSSS